MYGFAGGKPFLKRCAFQSLLGGFIHLGGGLILRQFLTDDCDVSSDIDAHLQTVVLAVGGQLITVNFTLKLQKLKNFPKIQQLTRSMPPSKAQFATAVFAVFAIWGVL